MTDSTEAVEGHDPRNAIAEFEASRRGSNLPPPPQRARSKPKGDPDISRLRPVPSTPDIEEVLDLTDEGDKRSKKRQKGEIPGYARGDRMVLTPHLSGEVREELEKRWRSAKVPKGEIVMTALRKVYKDLPTLLQQESIEIDGEEIFGGLSPKRRRLVDGKNVFITVSPDEAKGIGKLSDANDVTYSEMIEVALVAYFEQSPEY